MIKTICDICGEEINEDYTRSHYSYNLDFEGQKPHQTLRYRQDCNGATYGTTLMKALAYLTYYPDPKSWHLNLCGSCGSEFEKMIGDSIERLRNVHNKKANIEKLTEMMKDAANLDSSTEKMSLMDWDEWNRNHPEDTIGYDDATRTYSIGNGGEVNNED